MRHEHKCDETGNEGASTSYNHDSTRESCTCAARQIHRPQLWVEVAYSHGGEWQQGQSVERRERVSPVEKMRDEPC
jgi:hypothetical protein